MTVTRDDDGRGVTRGHNRSSSAMDRACRVARARLRTHCCTYRPAATSATVAASRAPITTRNIDLWMSEPTASARGVARLRPRRSRRTQKCSSCRASDNPQHCTATTAQSSTWLQWTFEMLDIAVCTTCRCAICVSTSRLLSR